MLVRHIGESMQNFREVLSPEFEIWAKMWIVRNKRHQIWTSWRNLEKRARNALRFCSSECRIRWFYHENNFAPSMKSTILTMCVGILDKNSNLSQLFRPKSAKDIAYYSATTILAWSSRQKLSKPRLLLINSKMPRECTKAPNIRLQKKQWAQFNLQHWAFMQIVARILRSNEHFDELRNNGAKVFLQLYLDSER